MWQRLVLVFALIAFGGCGVKGPPKPPRQAPPPAVVDLVHRVNDGSVTLTWRLPAPLSSEAARRASFGIFRSRTAIDAPACEDCPLIFEKVASAPYVDAADRRFTLDLPLDAGYRYVFKVHLEIGGTAGPDSNPVRFDFPSKKLEMPTEKP